MGTDLLEERLRACYAICFAACRDNPEALESLDELMAACMRFRGQFTELTESMCKAVLDVATKPVELNKWRLHVLEGGKDDSH